MITLNYNSKFYWAPPYCVPSIHVIPFFTSDKSVYSRIIVYFFLKACYHPQELLYDTFLFLSEIFMYFLAILINFNLRNIKPALGSNNLEIAPKAVGS